MIWIPAAENVKAIHNELVSIFSHEEDPISPSGVKSEAMLESACSRPHVGIGNHDKYPTMCDKVASLFFALIKNHPFHNGNKRTALVAALSMLRRNNYVLNYNIDDDAVYDLTLAVAANNFGGEGADASPDAVVDALGRWFRANTESITTTVESMKTDDFVAKCEQAGARVKTAGKGKSTLLSHNRRSVSFSKKTATLPGNVIRSYLRTLRLSESGAGIGVTELQEGASDEKQDIYRYMAALRRLAKT